MPFHLLHQLAKRFRSWSSTPDADEGVERRGNQDRVDERVESRRVDEGGMRKHLHRLQLGGFGSVLQRPESDGSVTAGGSDGRVFGSPGEIVNDGGVSLTFVLRFHRSDVEDQDEEIAVDVANGSGEISTRVGESQSVARRSGEERSQLPVGNATRLAGDSRPGNRD